MKYTGDDKPQYQKNEDHPGNGNSRYERTFETVDISTLNQHDETSGYWIFECPFCTEKRGANYWSNNRLYFSKKTNRGLCYQCNTVVFPELDEVQEERLELKSAISKFSEEGDSSENLGSIQFDFDPLDAELLRYLSNRNPLIVHLTRVLGLAKWEGIEKGVVTPFIDRGKVVKFQVRFPNRSKERKYYTAPPGTTPLYSPFHCFYYYNLFVERTVTLCEGTYDAIALGIMGYPNPLAVLGKTLTRFQINQLRRLVPEYCYIAMDEFDINLAVKKQVVSGVKSISEVIMKNFGGKDPEEYLVSTYKENRDSYVENVQSWIRGDMKVAR